MFFYLLRWPTKTPPLWPEQLEFLLVQKEIRRRHALTAPRRPSHT
jgi:hypothetical protein